jgi:hypothetical protein
MRLCMSSSIFIASIGDPAGPMLSASHCGVVACVMLVVLGSGCLVSGCSCPHSGMSRSVGVCSVASDLTRRITGSSGIILLLGVTGRLALVLDRLLSGVGLHCCTGFRFWSRVASAHVGGGDVAIDGGKSDTGNSCRLIRSGCLDGLLIAL